MNAKRKAIQWEQIEEHGERLNAAFGVNHDAQVLCRRLHRLETRARHLAERACCEEVPEIEKLYGRILDSVDALLEFRRAGVPVFVNGDPRGYALKVDNHYMREHHFDLPRDWGGYGILCPEFDGRD